MAGNGPLPKAQHQRERDTRRRSADVTTVRADGAVRGPALKRGHGYGPKAVAWYEAWRRAPQAQLFEATDWLALDLVLPLVDAHYLRPTASAASEIRLVTAALGGTYADRLRVAKIHIDREDDGPVAPVTPLHLVSRTAAEALLRRKPVEAPAPVADPGDDDPTF